MEIDVKYKPGQEVWSVHKYPAGAKVKLGKVDEVDITLKKSGIKVYYRFNDGFKIPFVEDQLFDNEEDALKAREEWCNRPDVKERAEKLSMSSIINTKEKTSGTDEERCN